MLVAAQTDSTFAITDFNPEVVTDKLHVRVTYNKSTGGWVTGQNTWRMDSIKIFTDAGKYVHCCYSIKAMYNILIPSPRHDSKNIFYH